MNTLTFNPLASKLSFDEDNMWVELRDGRKLSVPLAYFPRLLGADKKQLENYIISGGPSVKDTPQSSSLISVSRSIDCTGFNKNLSPPTCLTMFSSIKSLKPEQRIMGIF